VPEGLEVELYRRAATVVVGRTVADVDADQRIVRGDASRLGALPGSTVTGVGRVGKLLLVHTTDGVLGVHFGMTGRLVVDDSSPVERLAYGAMRDDAGWDRLVVGFRGGGSLRVNDPRRLGRVVPDPPLDGLGPDWQIVTRRQLGVVLAARRKAVKAVLLDQSAIAGLGNMCADEVLWWASIDPSRPAGTLDSHDVGALHRAIRRRLPVMLRRGGSHRGTLCPEVRAAVAPCPRDGRPLARSVVAGRTTVWCPHHQH
jgi:formamidopyrimidine-DNA glycosylase